MAKAEKIVLFLGAGASFACGYPLNSELLPEILRRLKEDRFKDDEHIKLHAKQLTRVFEQLLSLRKLEKLPEITEVLSLIDHCVESGEELFPPGRSSLGLPDLRWLLNRAMSRVVRCIHRKGRELYPRELLSWIKKLRNRGDDVTIASTNYDFSLDKYLFQDLGNWNTNFTKTDFGFTWRDPDDGELVHPSGDPKLRLYKLHGALNWLNCGRCGYTYVNFERTIVTLADGTGKWSTCHCGYRPLRAVLVAPSFVRRYRDRNILCVWRSTYEALRLADRWIMVGYSFPPEDVALRSLFIRAKLSRKRQPLVQVVNRGTGAFERYRQIFPYCEYTGDGLKAYIASSCTWDKRRRPKSQRWH